MRRSIWSALIAGLIAVGFSGAGPAAAQDQPRRGGILVTGEIGEPPNYDCQGGTSAQSLYYLAPHYSLLVKIDQQNQERVAGDLAESWTMSEDGRTYTFRLFANAVFHDGSPVTSRDVDASFNRLRDPPAGVVSPRRATFSDITAIETPDPRTVVFRLGRAVPYFLGVLANPFNCILSAAKLASDPNYPARVIMGSGPFRFVEHVAGSHWVATRFDRYFREGRPYLDGLRINVMANTSAVLTAMSGGQIMGEFRTFSPTERNRLVSEMGPRVTVQEKTWAAIIALVFNTERPPFNDARVRRALSMAIDRWTASANLRNLVSLRLVGGTQRPGSPFAISDEELATLPGFGRDAEAARAEARRLLQQAGVSTLTFRLTNRLAANPYTPIGIYLIDQWRRIGATVEHVQLDTGPWAASLRSGNFDAIIDITNEYIDDPDLELARYLSVDRSPQNPSRATDRALDALYDRQRALTGVAERAAIVREFERRAFTEAYQVPVLWFHRINVLSSRIRNWQITSNAILGLDMTDVWLAE
jgi:peptide/nickel transport system substrate-binding protein